MADRDIQDNVIRHAKADMANVVEGSIQPPSPTMGERAADWVGKNVEAQPSLGAQFDAMFREAIKDIRQTFNEAWFGKGEHAAEMGTPMNPTPQMETDSLMGKHGTPAPAAPAVEPPSQATRDVGFDRMLDSYADRIASHEQDRGMGMER